MNKSLSITALLSLTLLLPGCSSTPAPIHAKTSDNICHIFQKDPTWEVASKKVYRKYGTPPWTQLAIVKHESSFKSDARPGRKYYFGLIPGPRKSSALGYSQALDGTFDEFKRATGNSWASRTDIEDSLEFIGWYNRQSQKRSGISLRNARTLYLAYYLGHGGYNRKKYRNNPWLMKRAKEVQKTAVKYMRQYKRCS